MQTIIYVDRDGLKTGTDYCLGLPKRALSPEGEFFK